MRFVLILLLAVGVLGAYRWWSVHSLSDEVVASPNGFVPVEMPGGVGLNTVLILAPQNCPSDQAQRTEALIKALTEENIPFVRGDSFVFDAEHPTAEQMAGMDRAVVVFKRGAPAVFVNGMAMSNPSAAQTLAEYRATRGARSVN